jgi:Putative Actinobacterial Holin-X, holin superfamily III
MHSPERSISQLLGDSLSELAKLIQNEVDVARAELLEKVSLVAGAAKLIGAGAVLMIPAVVLILFSISAALMQGGFTPALAYLCTGVAAAVVSGLLIWAGAGRLSARALAPTATLAELRKDKTAATELMR